MRRISLKVTYKWLFAVLGLSAVITEIVVLSSRAIFNPSNFFSFFTIESNILAVISLALSGWYVYRRQDSAKLDFFRGAVALYMITTGVVFSLLLSDLDPGVLTAVPWDNTVLHYIMPIVVALDWFIDPPAQRVAVRRAVYWLAFPLLYLIYSLVRGSMVNWYPYPFLNPTNGGFQAIAVVAVGILVFSLVIVWILTRTARRNA